MIASGTEPFRTARIDHATFRRIAREVFGIERRISLRRARTYRRHGSWTADRFEHRIMLAQHATIEGACRTLAHELWHAVQCEGMAFPEYVTYHKSQRRVPYDRRPIEVEAREAEEAFWQELLPAFNVGRTA